VKRFGKSRIGLSRRTRRGNPVTMIEKITESNSRKLDERN
jgi:hypothetical protein